MTRPALRWSDAGVFALFFLLLLRAVEDPDIWFHLAIGRAVLEQGGLPASEFYLFTRLGQPAEFHEWGFGVLFELARRLGGLGGLITLNALLGASTLFLLYRSALESGTTVAAALAATVAGWWLMEFRFAQRPEDLLYLALAVTLWLCQRQRRDGDWRWLLPIPAVGWLLAQGHPSVILLGLVLGTFLVEALARRRPDWRGAGLFAATIVATLGLSLLNPYGLQQLLLPLEFMGETALLAGIAEFLPALSTEYAPRFLAGCALALFALSGLRRRFSPAEWLMLGAFALLAFQHVRNIALLGLALVGPLATALDATIPRVRVRRGLAVLALLLAVADVLPRHRLWPDIEPTAAPLQGAERIARETRGGNILNFYHLGNYLAWRLAGSHRVLIDGRNFRDNPALALHDRLLLAAPGWRRELRRLGIVAVVTPATLPWSGELIPLTFALAGEPGWRLAAREPAGLTFLWTPGHLPDAGERREVWLQAEEELRENLRNYPDSPGTRRSLAMVERRLRAGSGRD